MKVFTKILRQEIDEEVVSMNPLTGSFEMVHKKPGINDVIKAGAEILKRYPINNDLLNRKLEAETKIIEHEASKLDFDKEKQQNIMDLISIGHELIGGGYE